MATKKSTSKHSNSTLKRIYRVQDNKIVGGVASGIGEYFTVDPTIIRVLFVLLALFGGSGIFLYIVLWIIMPSQNDLNAKGKDAIYSNFEDMKQTAQQTVNTLNKSTNGENKSFWAIILVVIGVLVLVNNYDFFNVDIGKLWPILLVILGLLILRRK